jgi:hypothetical protein
VSEYQILELRRLADKSVGRRVQMFDVDTGEPKLVNPDTPGYDHEPWPTLGITIINSDGPPRLTTISTDYANQLVADGLLERVGERPVIRPAGPHAAPWSSPPHVFIHADTLVFKDHERGPVTYKVTRQPDKFVTEGSDVPVTDYVELLEHELPLTSVEHFYNLELVLPTMNQVGVGGKEGRRG